MGICRAIQWWFNGDLMVLSWLIKLSINESNHCWLEQVDLPCFWTIEQQWSGFPPLGTKHFESTGMFSMTTNHDLLRTQNMQRPSRCTKNIQVDQGCWPRNEDLHYQKMKISPKWFSFWWSILLIFTGESRSSKALAKRVPIRMGAVRMIAREDSLDQLWNPAGDFLPTSEALKSIFRINLFWFECF